MPVIGEVITLSGDVRAVMDGAERVLTTGSPVNQGETILTAQGSTVQIQLADESILAQGENASQTIDSFIYDPNDASGSNMLINMAQGTFRMVTGKVGEANPEGVAVKTPLATIGIRGTGIDLDVQAALTKIGCFLHDGLDVTITGEQGTRILNAVNTILDILASGEFGEIRNYSEFEKAFFKAAAPILGIPEDQLYGGDQGQGEGGGDDGDDGQGDDDTGDGDTGDGGDGGDGEQANLAELFEELFGTEEQPTNLLQQLFEALTSGEDTLTAGTTGQDTLVGGGDDDDDDTLPGDDDDGEVAQTTVTDGDDDGRDFSEAGADNVDDGTARDDYLEGTSDKDLMRGYGGNDDIAGFEGNDTLFGGAGNDTLSGMCDNDLLVGGTGDDTIAGEGGKDTMWGGSGADSFKYYSTGEGGDTIKDFESGTDMIIFSSSGYTVTYTSMNNPTYNAGAGSSSFFYDTGTYGGTVNGTGNNQAGFVFDADDNLWYDSDLANSGGEELIAHIEDGTLLNTDIVIM